MIPKVLEDVAHALREKKISFWSVPGDCDCRSIYVQSALESLGYPTRFAITKGKRSDQYDHVYSEVKTEDGQWKPLDTIMNGKEGRPLFSPGEELKFPEAKEKRTISVKGSILPFVIGALIWGFFR